MKTNQPCMPSTEIFRPRFRSIAIDTETNKEYKIRGYTKESALRSATLLSERIKRPLCLVERNKAGKCIGIVAFVGRKFVTTKQEGNA